MDIKKYNLKLETVIFKNTKITIKIITLTYRVLLIMKTLIPKRDKEELKVKLIRILGFLIKIMP